SVGIQYLSSWLRGNGAVAIFNLMEDAATAEIARSQVWQWIRHGRFERDNVRAVIGEELERLRAEFGDEVFAKSRADDARRLWELLHTEPYVPTLGALTGGQAVQMVKAGLKAIYLSGWQVAADANLAGHTYPDQSLYPSNSGPALVRRLNNALLRADQIHAAEDDTQTYWLAPIVADAEAGFGGPLNAFEVMKAFIEAG